MAGVNPCESPEQAAARQFGVDADSFSRRPCSGGCIHRSSSLWHASSEVPLAFLKENALAHAALFTAEADGLRALAAAGQLRVPRVLAQGTHESSAWLLLEYLPLQPLNALSSAQLGAQLAQLHHHSAADHLHGWPQDNFIGTTPQLNTPHASWCQFFIEQRLRPQFDRARSGGCIFPEEDDLLQRADELLRHHQPEPSLLHGDLWSGNAAALPDDQAVLFDPACFYGDRETDIAFSRQFGGFSASFYAAYEANWPLPPDAPQREPLYQLYHWLNHLNLFGSSYLPSVKYSLNHLLHR
ncbi:MAG: fructosamine kinase family protein [Verrucomicrobiales bacterium]|nr:fructosamine kinase family protein [Verrucomicrobiales bacterium]